MKEKKSNVDVSKNLNNVDNNSASSDILKEIGNFVLKETEKSKKKGSEKNIFVLTEDLKIKNGRPNKPTKIPVKIATLKSIIQKIVSAELKKRN